MINSANAHSLSELFNPDKDLMYFIPKYQREYVWGKHNWELLFDDIIQNDDDHFLGSIICINNKLDSLSNDRLELVDGQQRITTINLLLLAIYDHLKSLSSKIEDEEELLEFQTDLHNLKYRIILKKDKKTLRLQPSISGNNLKDFQHTFSYESTLLKDKFERSHNAGIRRIVKAYRYFKDRLGELKEDTQELIFNLEETQTFLSKLTKSVLVKIEVNSHSDAFTLFETLNNRGVPLSPLDMIKNTYLNETDKLNDKSVDDNFEKWNRLISNLGDEYATQERFLRHFYHAYKNDPTVEVKGKTRATRTTLITIYETLIKRNLDVFFEKLFTSSKVYNQLIFPENTDESETVKSCLKDIRNVGGVTAYSLLLFVFEDFELNENQKVELINYLVKFFFRRNITDTPPTRDLHPRST